MKDNEMNNETKYNEIAFTKVKLPFGWLGNMAPFPIIFENIEYKTTEALFQALRFKGYPEIQEKIRNEKSPMSAKLVAKAHVSFLEQSGFEMMGEQDVKNMRLCLKLKLDQHPELKQQLIDTQNSLIIEDCTSRPQGSGIFWGAAKQNDKWFGKNVLGELWMELRNDLINSFENNNKEIEDEIKNIEYEFFFNLKSPFSNFHPSKIEYKDFTFCSNEQFMMFAKAKTFSDENACSKLLEINNSPLIKDFLSHKISREDIINDYNISKQWNRLMMDIKAIGRTVQNFREDVWSKKCESVVLFGARLKFTQNSDLNKVLLETKDKVMVEASPYDKIWGIGLSEADAKKTPVEKWPGKNLLGKVLTKLKIELIEKLSNNINNVEEAKQDINIWKYIRVVNIRGDNEYLAQPDEKIIVAHRDNPILGNQHPMKSKSMSERNRVIQANKEDLEEDLLKQGPMYKVLKEIAKDIVENNQKIAMQCFCAPCDCHADNYLPVIVKMAQELLNEKNNSRNLKMKR